MEADNHLESIADLISSIKRDLSSFEELVSVGLHRGLPMPICTFETEAEVLESNAKELTRRVQRYKDAIEREKAARPQEAVH